MREGEGKNLREDKKDNKLLGGMVTSAIALITWDGVDRDRANERWGTGQDSSKKGDTTIVRAHSRTDKSTRRIDCISAFKICCVSVLGFWAQL